MLYLISIGLCDEKDMSLKALETAKKCESLYIELYTTKLETSLEKLEKLVGKKVVELDRSGMEENSGKLIKEAKTKDVGVFIGGDALSATTHSSLILDAKKDGVKTKIIHGSSVFTAIGETGLHLYKFGAATTLVFPEKNYFPTSCYETILKNKNIGLHTLVLLDVKTAKRGMETGNSIFNRCMSVREGMEILLKIEKEKKQNLISENTFLVVCSNLGSESQKIKYGKVKNLVKEEFGTPAVLVLPGELHFSEKEFLSLL